jgi:DNA-directed RNA polymerase subunit RPC12/RpoP
MLLKLVNMVPRFYIDYPQEKIEEGSNIYRCSICKEKALTINGLLENHKASCNYRIDKEKLLSGKK